uniref:Uncharacterized protein n=1 Tax=Anopheles culicifacies TaxID=139723 RepID=A0A182MRF1_9DIPT
MTMLTRNFTSQRSHRTKLLCTSCSGLSAYAVLWFLPITCIIVHTSCHHQRYRAGPTFSQCLPQKDESINYPSASFRFELDGSSSPPGGTSKVYLCDWHTEAHGPVSLRQ